ncbi:hypothetical protein EMCRGX_G021488 [Ephydatia muelleri]
MRHISSQIVGDNLKGEIAPFLFPIPSGGEEMKGAPLVYIPQLVDKVVQLLEGNERTGRLTWHEGFIPANIVNVATPNSVHNTCVFSCFAAGDSVTNLHVALDRFNDQVEHLHGMKWSEGASGCYPCLYCKIHSDQMAIPLIVRGHAKERSLEDMYADHQCYVSSGSVKKDEQMFFNCISEPIFDIPVHRCSICWKLYACCQLDLELTSQITDFNSSSFSKYSQVLQRLPLFQADLETAQHAHEVLQQVATYVALVHGKKNPLAVDLLKQSAAKKRPVKALEAEVAKCTAT